MEQPSQLESFLKEHASEGRVESAGEFTLAREKALAKMAEFQLPFEGAWAVKILQAAVAAGAHSAVRVDLTSKETRFYFALAQDWDLDAIEQSFYSPEPGPDRSLNHLVSGLWAVGLNQKRPFQIVLPGGEDSLIWDGTNLSRVEPSDRRDCLYLAVSSSATESGALGWVKTMAKSGGRNAAILKALSERCYVCPIPLTVDGRRLDSLQLCPEHGYSKTTYPVSISFIDGDIPSLGVPPGTFEDLRSYMERAYEGGGLKTLTDSVAETLEPREQAAVALLLTAHVELVQKGKHAYWEPAFGSSKCYWVQDGAVIDEDFLEGGATSCTAAIFVSAQGLPTDLTGIRLAEDHRRQERLFEAARLTHRVLVELGGVPTARMVAKGATRAKAIGGILMLCGVGTLWASPLHGIGLLVGGGITVATGGKSERVLAGAVQHGLHETTRNLGIRYLR